MRGSDLRHQQPSLLLGQYRPVFQALDSCLSCAPAWVRPGLCGRRVLACRPVLPRGEVLFFHRRKTFFPGACPAFCGGVCCGVLSGAVLWGVCCGVRPASLPRGAARFFHFFKKFFKIFSVWSLFSGTASKTAGGICGTSAGLYRVHRAHRAKGYRAQKSPTAAGYGAHRAKEKPRHSGRGGVCCGVTLWRRYLRRRGLHPDMHDTGQYHSILQTLQ